MSRKRKRRKQQGLQHIVVRTDGSHGGLEPDCPICALLAAQGQDVLAFDPDSMELSPESVKPMGPVTPITLEVDALVAAVLAPPRGSSTSPRGMLVGEFLIGRTLHHPAAGESVPGRRSGAAARRSPARLAAPVPAGPVTLVAKALPRQALA